MEKRLEDIDIIRGICIIFMVLGHVNLGTNFDYYIHAFHMPIFFIISGLFYERNTKCSFMKILKKQFKKLIIPYIFFSMAYYFISCITKIDFISYKENLLSIFTTNDLFIPIGGALWFLTSMFFCQLIIFAVDKICKNENLFMIICILISIIGVNINKIIPFRLWFSISSSLVGVGLVCIGYLIKKYNIKQKLTLKVNFINITITIILFFINFYIIMNTPYVNMRLGIYPSYFMFIFNLIFSIFVYLNISNILLKINIIGKILQKIGKNSIVFLCLNQLIIIIISKFIVNTEIFINKFLISVIVILVLYFLSILYERINTIKTCNFKIKNI